MIKLSKKKKKCAHCPSEQEPMNSIMRIEGRYCLGLTCGVCHRLIRKASFEDVSKDEELRVGRRDVDMNLSELIAECVRLAPNNSQDFHLEHFAGGPWRASCCYLDNAWQDWCEGDTPEEAVMVLLRQLKITNKSNEQRKT